MIVVQHSHGPNDLGEVEVVKSETGFIHYALDVTAIVAITNVQGTITHVNNKFCEISGYSQHELIGQNHRLLRSDAHDKTFFREMYRQIARGQVWRGEICNRRKDGTTYWVDTTIVPHLNTAGNPDSYTSIRFDVTRRHQIEEDLRSAVSTDALTGTANRRRFQEYLTATLELSNSTHTSAYLALIDIDAFKEINDTFGHIAGDNLLKNFAERLRAFETENIFIARLGGDEFGIVISDKACVDVPALLDEVLDSIKQPVWLGNIKHRYTASIGVAAFPMHAKTPDGLFKAADMALYHSKASGRDQRQCFAPRLQLAVEYKSALLQAVEAGLDRNQFSLYYQAVVPTVPGKLISLEGLLRWQHPERGLLSPGAFLTEINDPGLESEIGMFVVERAFKDMARILEEGLPVDRLAINVANADFRSDRFVDRFFELSAQTGISPSRFCVEVVEQVFLGTNFQSFQDRLFRLHDAGVELALDDFGTGFASLTHLRRIPIDRVKIDRGFISCLPASVEDLVIVKGIIDIAHALGKSVTAEGIETEEQATLLQQLGADGLQGWYFSKACTVENLPNVLIQLSRRSRLRH
jgi:diguanylate cyclase (GGDEF)-like protein/PAS domain S-box-containing protein